METSTTIFIEGNIGAGKSTLIDFLKKQSFIKTHPEPVAKWQNVNGFNLLNLLYEDPKKYSFLFQSYAMLTMMERHATDVDKNKINIMERSISTTKECFIRQLCERNIIEQPYLEVLYKWIDFFQKQFELEPKFIIYLKTNPENLVQRIQKRGRSEEQNINLTLLRELHQHHEEYIEGKKNTCKILTVNANLKLNETVLNEILSFVKEAGQK